MHMKRQTASILLLSLFLGVMAAGCAQKYTTTFTPPEKQAPETLDMSYEGPRANIAVGDFTVKASGATNYIGDGLREMLESALFESLRFNVLDRLDPQGIKAEQQLSYSKMAKSDSPKLGAQMEVAELMFYGTVTEFEAESKGVGVTALAPRVPASASAGAKNAHMAIDIRVVDVASGRVVAAKRVAGSAASYKATAGALLGGGDTAMPVSLGAFSNTAMELAIRDCIYRSVIYACNSLPRDYFQY
jgi:curli biogenesis system outer membrane secretion channel CsgG